MPKKKKTYPKEQQHFGKHNMLQNTQAFWKTQQQYFRKRNISENKTPFPNTQRHFRKTQHFRKHAVVLENTNMTVFQMTQQHLYKAQQHFSLFTLILVMLCTNVVFCEMLSCFDPEGSRSIILFKDISFKIKLKYPVSVVTFSLVLVFCTDNRLDSFSVNLEYYRTRFRTWKTSRT